jgi:hypothetical protein
LPIQKPKTSFDTRYEKYLLKSSNSFFTFKFVSEGPKGFIKKRIQYSITSKKDYYNLAFGDVDKSTNDFDDLAITNNNDIEKVLATIAASIFVFFENYPNANIYIEGSTRLRTRLYRIAISNNLDELTEYFYIYGLLEEVGWMPFYKNGNFLAYIIKKKN